MSSCWLNACLQLVLAGFDHSSQSFVLNSELGKELKNIHNLDSNSEIDPTNVKNIIIYAEDTRIAIRKSELMNEIQDQYELARQLRNLEDLYLNLKSGQQCVRDFFLCIGENVENWTDFNEIFNFNLVNSTTCLACNHENISEQNQIYLEMEVPPDGSNLGEYVEQNLNGSSIVEYNCQDGCKRKFQADKRTLIKSIEQTEFLIILLRRSIATTEGIEIVTNMIQATDNIDLRYVFIC